MTAQLVQNIVRHTLCIPVVPAKRGIPPKIVRYSRFARFMTAFGFSPVTRGAAFEASREKRPNAPWKKAMLICVFIPLIRKPPGT